ncbi:hypothetical protein AB9F34_34530, partial [Rhizobium leguminosarum]|uniref:hypothetical protein n=1 Tax=Rhizobium leguminosarum TaxID=384 RepID=UPI003F95E678
GLFAQLFYFPTDEIICANRFTMTPDILPRQRRLIAQQLTISVARELAENEEERLRFDQGVGKRKPGIGMFRCQGKQHQP